MHRIIVKGWLLLLCVCLACEANRVCAALAVASEPASPPERKVQVTHLIVRSEIIAPAGPVETANESEVTAPAGPVEAANESENSAQVTEVRLSEPVSNTPMTEQLIAPVSIVRFDWKKAEKGEDYREYWHNDDLDFSALGLTVTDLIATETQTAITAEVAHPAAWSMLESQSMNGFFLNFAVLLDGEQAEGFYVAAKSVRLGFATKDDRCDRYTVTLVSDRVTSHTLAAHGTLTLLPTVDSFENYLISRYVKQHGDEVAISGGHTYGRAKPQTVPLSERAVTIDLHALCRGVEPEQPQPKAQSTVTFTVHAEDVAREIDEGIYGKDGEYPWYGVMHNVTLDVTDVRVYIDGCTVWDLGAYIRFHWTLPEDWTPTERWDFAQNLLLDLSLNGERKNGKNARMFTGHGRWIGVPDDAVIRCEAEADAFTATEYRAAIWTGRDAAKLLTEAGTAEFIVRFQHVKTIRYRGTTYNLDEAPSPNANMFLFDYVEGDSPIVPSLSASIPPRMRAVPSV